MTFDEYRLFIRMRGPCGKSQVESLKSPRWYACFDYCYVMQNHDGTIASNNRFCRNRDNVLWFCQTYYKLSRALFKMYKLINHKLSITAL
jgi:hypothetical protein